MSDEQRIEDEDEVEAHRRRLDASVEAGDETESDDDVEAHVRRFPVHKKD
ncbi:MAG TPA: hypothetical protein VE995_03490 [Gaiellaceae bacterium]|nr:hypothetical protein [Gaiellaceae bacterium]